MGGAWAWHAMCESAVRGSERMDIMDHEISVIVRVVHNLPFVTICSVFITAKCIMADTNTFNNRNKVYCNYLI
jgi:hypothetical protein